MGLLIEEDNGKLICVKDGHDEPVIWLLKNDEVPLQDRFYCSICLGNDPKPDSLLPIDQAIDWIKEKLATRKSRQYQRKKKYINLIQEFQESLRVFQAKIIKVLDDTQRKTKKWIQEIENFAEDEINLIQAFKIFLRNDDILKLDSEEIKKKNMQNCQQIELIFKQLGDQADYNNCYDALKNIMNETCHQQNNNLSSNQMQFQINREDYNSYEQHKVSKIELIDTIKRKEYSRAIAFNKAGTTMVSGCDDDIMVWKFYKGEIFKQKKLKGHTDWILCFAFSQKSQWFASGSQDCTIRCWKEKAINDWICSKPGQKHTDYVMYLLLNKVEDQLISCSLDHSINVWKVDPSTNGLEYDYTLEGKHTDSVFCISLNESESSLVSCSQDQTIVLWNKDEDQKWVYQHHIVTEDQGFKISFFGENYMVWQQNSKGIAHIIEVNKGNLLKRPELQIELNQSSDNNYLFPPIINRQKQVILLKHNKYVYLIQQSQKNGKLQAIQPPIECNNQTIYGAMTLNGEYVVIFNSGINEYRIYNINYGN